MIPNSFQVFLTFLESWGSNKDIYIYWKVLQLENQKERQKAVDGKMRVRFPQLLWVLPPPNLSYLAVKYGDHRCPRKPVHPRWEAQDLMPSFDSTEIISYPSQLKKWTKSKRDKCSLVTLQVCISSKHALPESNNKWKPPFNRSSFLVSVSVVPEEQSDYAFFFES